MVVLISSAKGNRKETRFVGGKRGREIDILRACVRGMGLFTRMDFTLCDSLYGMIPQSEKVEADDMEDVLGVLELCDC